MRKHPWLVIVVTTYIVVLGLASGSAAEPADRLQVGDVDPAGASTDAQSPQAPEPDWLEPADAFTPTKGAVYEWSLQAPGANGLRSETNATTDLSVPATSDNIPYAGWAACGVRDSRYKVVHDYRRRFVNGRQARTYTRLYCGLYERDGSESRFGYRHIKDRHAGDWQRKADYIRRNWRDLAGWTMMHTFRDPGAAFMTNERFCYQRMFYLYHGKTQVSRMRAIYYLGVTGVRIMTGFPTNAGQCHGVRVFPN